MVGRPTLTLARPLHTLHTVPGLLSQLLARKGDSFVLLTASALSSHYVADRRKILIA
jgi:hypothetical protein